MEDSNGSRGPSSILHSPSSLSPLAWAAFLGISWTWCIGMFLPVLLVRDYGLWGWIVFAVPNVLGAAAMGWVMRRVDDPHRFYLRHLFACTAFSLVTIAFHLFFMFWIIAKLLPGGAIVCLVAAAIIFMIGLQNGGDIPAAVAVFVISLVCWAIFAMYGWIWPLAGEPLRNTTELIYLAPVCVFGFALCPYLDRTFQLAYRANGPSSSRTAFGVGFGLIFVLMILFTLCYARRLASAGEPADFGTIGAVAWAIGIHMALQSAFTIAAHLRPTTRVFVPLVAAAILAALIYGIAALIVGDASHSTGETAYRLFMGFYGLVFPAYVLICMIPLNTEPTRRQTNSFIVAVLLALPSFWIGFMEQKTVWLLPGLLIILAAKFVAMRRPEGAKTL